MLAEAQFKIEPKNEKGHVDMELSKKETFIIKGIAIFMMLMHHLYLSPSRYEGYTISFAPFSESFVIDIAVFGKICVSLFAFLSGYGLLASLKNALEKKSVNTIEEKRTVTASWTFKQVLKLMIGFFFVYVICFVISMLLNQKPLTVYFDGSHMVGCLYLIIDALGLANLFDTPSLCGTWWYMSAAIIYAIAVPIIYYFVRRVGWLPVLAIWVALPRLLNIGFPGGTNAWTFALPLMIGMIFNDKKIFSRLDSLRFSCIRKRRDTLFSPSYAILFLLIAIVAFRLYTNVAQSEMWELVYGVIPIFIICLIRYAIAGIPVIADALYFVGKHSMTIFLTHTFIRNDYLSDVVYSNGNWLLNFLVLFVLSLLVAVIIDKFKEILHYPQLQNTILSKFS